FFLGYASPPMVPVERKVFHVMRHSGLNGRTTGKCCNGQTMLQIVKSAMCVPETCPKGFVLLANQANSADCYFYSHSDTETWEQARVIGVNTVWTGANDRDKDGNYIFDIENSPFSKTSLPFGS
ncbi:Hypothetical predicted protein, partial [Mytilus galloprovincialis]